MINEVIGTHSAVDVGNENFNKMEGEVSMSEMNNVEVKPLNQMEEKMKTDVEYGSSGGVETTVELANIELNNDCQSQMDQDDESKATSEMTDTQEAANDLNESSAGSKELGKEEAIWIDVDSIQYDPFFDCRKALNKNAVKRYTGRFKDYKVALEKGEECDYPFPEILVWHDEGRYVRLTGDHRLTSARDAGLTKIKVKVFYGSKTDALKIALLDNRKNAVPLTDGDLRICIEKAWKLFPDKTPGVIADMLECSRPYASEVMNELSATSNVKVPTKRKGKDGKMYPSTKPKCANKQKSKDKASSINSSEVSSNSMPDQSTDKALMGTPVDVLTTENATDIDSESTQPATSIPDGVNPDNAVSPIEESKEPEKSLADRKKDALPYLHNIIRDVATQESLHKGIRYAESLMEECRKAHKSLKEQLDQEKKDASKANDQLAKAS